VLPQHQAQIAVSLATILEHLQANSMPQTSGNTTCWCKPVSQLEHIASSTSTITLVLTTKTIGQGGPTNAEFANLWRQLAKIYANQTRVVFGVMNEPHDIANITLWAGSVQAADTAIRKTGATTQMILLPGTDFTSAETFISNGSAGNLSAVANPDGSKTGLIFDVHKYLDFDNSGTHLECVANHINDSFAPLVTFLKTNNRMAMLSEIGGSSNKSVSCQISSNRAECWWFRI
jgi:hypothetical protein